MRGEEKNSVRQKSRLTLPYSFLMDTVPEHLSLNSSGERRGGVGGGGGEKEDTLYLSM